MLSKTYFAPGYTQHSNRLKYQNGYLATRQTDTNKETVSKQDSEKRIVVRLTKLINSILMQLKEIQQALTDTAQTLKQLKRNSDTAQKH